MEVSGSQPRAGTDYPRNWRELHEWFPDDAACLAYLERLRCGYGFVCPRCGVVGSYWRMGDGLRPCTACRKRSSVTAGTIFAGTRTRLALWFAACWYVVNQKNGVSALRLQRVLGLGSYETASVWLHKLRRAMVRPGRDLLADAVEVDETYVGGVRPGTRRVAAEPQGDCRDRGRGPWRGGRVRAHAMRPLREQGHAHRIAPIPSSQPQPAQRSEYPTLS